MKKEHNWPTALLARSIYLISERASAAAQLRLKLCGNRNDVCRYL